MSPSVWIARYRLPLFALLLAATPVVVWGAKQAWDSNSNRVEDWLPEAFEETQQLMWFVEHFGTDELLMISWEGCTLEDERLERLRERLGEPVSANGQSVKLFQDVFTGTQVFEQFTKGPLELSRTQALRRMQGWLVGPDGVTTGAVAVVSPAGAADRHAAVQYVYRAAKEAAGLKADQIRVAGPTIEGVAIDQASKNSLLELNALSFLVCLAVMVLCLRNARVAAIVFAVAIFNQQMSMALVHYTGSQMDSVLLLTANLVYVLSISAGIHLVNYYRDALISHGIAGAPGRALADGWLPCLLGAVTTSVGLASLAVSQLIPITKFGIYSAVAVLASAVILLLTIPAVLSQWPARSWVRRDSSASPELAEGCDLRREVTVTGRLLDALFGAVSRCHVVVVAFAVILLLAGAWGATRIRTSASLHNMFSPEARVLQDYEWLEENIGPLVPVEVVVRIPRAAQWSIVDSLRLVEEVREAVQTVEGIDCTLSAATFAPSLAGTVGSGVRQIARAAVLRHRLEERRQDFVEARFLQETPQHQHWRISARVQARKNHDYGSILRLLEQRVSPVLQSAGAAAGQEIAAEFFGGVPLVHKAQSQLLEDLLQSFAVAFALIALSMMLLLRSPLAGLVSMLPNVLPSVAVFGMMGWRRQEVEIGSILTASAALGIAVDNTLHFVTWFRRGVVQGCTRGEAIRYAYRRCGLPMIQTSLICALGLVVFSLSPFMPIARFGLLMFTLLLTALICDLLILPAILAGPAGRVFMPRRRAATEISGLAPPTEFGTTGCSAVPPNQPATHPASR